MMTVKQQLFLGFSSCLALGSLPVAAQAQSQGGVELPWVEDILPEWGISGSISARYDDFVVNGDEANNSFSSQGGQYFGNFDLAIDRQFSQFNSLEAQFFGAFNFSDFRSGSRVFVPERASLTWNYGEGPLPFRATAGDFFASYTPLTLNTSLKGVAIEVQSPSQIFGANHSFHTFAGTRAQAFRDLDLFDDQTHLGASWLSEWENSAVSVNWNTAQLASEASNTGEGVTRSTASVAAAHDFNFSENNYVTIESEFAGSFGDALNLDDQTSGLGGFAEVTGYYDKFDYHAKFEQFSVGYSPIGASIESDRQRFGFEVGRSFENNVSVQLRGEQIRDNLTEDTGPVLRTRVVGANLRGGLKDVIGLPTINSSLDVFVQQNDVSDDTSQSRNFVANLNTNIGIDSKTSATIGLLFDDNNDQIGEADSRRRQARVGLRRAFELFNTTGSINTGFVVRDLDQGAGSDVDFGPSADLSLKRGAHSLSMNANYLGQRFDEADRDLNTLRLGAKYSYQKGPHVFGLNVSLDRRSPEDEGRTDSIKFGASYTVRFQKTPRSLRRNSGGGDLSQSGSQSVSNGELFLDRLRPGAVIDESFNQLERAGISGAVPFGRALVFEESYFSRVRNRQRLVLVQDETRDQLEAAAVIIDVEEARGPQGLRSLIDEVRDELTSVYGRPTVFERGEIGRNISDDIQNGSFIYIAEWDLPDGRIRMGIPERLDGQVRLEVQYQTSFPPVDETDWSITDVR